MKQSGFLAEQQALLRATADASERVTQQMMIDTLQITLHDDFGFGYERLMRLTESWMARYRKYHAALERPKNRVEDERDAYRIHMDRKLAEIINGRAELIPFERRYPEAKRVTYDPPKNT